MAPIAVLWKNVSVPGVQRVLHVDVATTAKVKDLANVVEEQLKLSDTASKTVYSVRYVSLYGEKLPLERSLSPLLLSTAPTAPRLVVAVKLWAHGTIGLLTVQSICGARFQLEYEEDDTVGNVMDAIEARMHWQDIGSTLIYNRVRPEREWQMASLEIPLGGVVHVIPRLRGGGTGPQAFADVSDGSILVQVGFSQSAPAWRLCDEGLNIEGRCKNPLCKAFDKMVIHPNGFHAFNLTRDSDDPKCPACLERFKPLTCGFYNCVWKFDGVKATATTEVISSPWKTAFGEKYHRFDADESAGTVDWQSLIIIVKPRRTAEAVRLVETVPPAVNAAPRDLCTICWDALEPSTLQGPTTTPCEHTFHGECLQLWTACCEIQSTPSTCPLCRSGL